MPHRFPTRQREHALRALRAALDLTGLERQVLGFLNENGPTHRRYIVAALASPESKIGRHLAGHAALDDPDKAAAMVMGNWCRRLTRAALVRQARHSDGRYRHHEITAAGQLALQRAAEN